MRFFILICLFAVPALCSAEIYKWTDEKGQTGYSDDLGKVPKKFRDHAVLIEKQEKSVEIIEKSEPEKPVRKKSDGKGESAASKDDKPASQDKPLYGGKDGATWKQDLARQKYEVKSLEDQAIGLKERMTDASKMSRGEYLTLQNTLRDLDVRTVKARKKLEELNDAAEKAEVPAEFR